MAVTSMATAKKAKTKGNVTKAPAQHSQPSRKGKKAWRKNIDIGEVNEGLEEARADERVTGSTLQSKNDSQLFQIDVKGDEKVRHVLPRFDASRLSYTKQLAQRSAVPAVFSRPSSTSSKKRPLVTREDKDRLLRIGKRMRRGPLGAILDVDHSQLGAGSASLEPSHAVQKSGGYDVWRDNASAKEGGTMKENLPELEEVPNADVKKVPVKHPRLPIANAPISIPAVTAPHVGTSYNPPVHAHNELLQNASAEYARELAEKEKYANTKEVMLAARREVDTDEKVEGALGMKVDVPEEEEEEEEHVEPSEEVVVTRKPAARKTKQQRRKAEKLRAEKRALLEHKHKKRLLSSISPSVVKGTLRSLEHRQASRAAERARRQADLAAKLREKGLAGQRIGRHKVKVGETEVQLGEDLSESLRGLKVEGNLFRDRFLSMQQRALVEPRALVVPTKRQRAKTKEVEKHAWKRFE